MFHYFGYGSNINLVSLKAKGVEPLSSVRGIIRGWQLRFNVQHWFRHEGGVGNIQPTGNMSDVVEGLLHACRNEDLASLDAMESFGNGYDRVSVDVDTGQGTQKAFAYTGLPEFLNDDCLPSRRYLNIIIKGAEIAGLSKPYIDRLREQKVHVPDEYPEFQYPPDNGHMYDENTLAMHPQLTALAGAVFDMRGARKQLDCLGSLFGGKDMTLFHLKRLDTSDGTETLEDVRRGNLSAPAKKYLNAYLHEYAREFRYAGRYQSR
jgi:sulfite reductase (NADPH) flavoprotein alpha-component